MTVIERKYASQNELDHTPPIGDGLGNADRLEWLRTDLWAEYRLDLWNTGEVDEMGKSMLAYRLARIDHERPVRFIPAERAPEDIGGWEILFAGEDFHCGLGRLIDDDSVVADIIGFLSCKPGDVEDDYFADYTPRQLEFAIAEGEELSMWSAELEGELN